MNYHISSQLPITAGCISGIYDILFLFLLLFGGGVGWGVLEKFYTFKEICNCFIMSLKRETPHLLETLIISSIHAIRLYCQ